MNIIDIFGDSKPAEDDLSKRIAIKAETQKIEARTNEILKNILDFISEEARFIKNGLSYCPSSPSALKLTDDEKEIITQKLCELVKNLPEKISNELKDLLPCKENKDNDKSEEENKDNDKTEEEKVEIVTVKPTAITPNYFGY